MPQNAFQGPKPQPQAHRLHTFPSAPLAPGSILFKSLFPWPFLLRACVSFISLCLLVSQKDPSAKSSAVLRKCKQRNWHRNNSAVGKFTFSTSTSLFRGTPWTTCCGPYVLKPQDCSTNTHGSCLPCPDRTNTIMWQRAETPLVNSFEPVQFGLSHSDESWYPNIAWWSIWLWIICRSPCLKVL